MSDHDFEVQVVATRRVRRKKAQTIGSVQEAPARGWKRNLFFCLLWLMKPRRMTWIPAALIAAVVMFGTPHLLVTFRCSALGTPNARCSACNYFGVQGMQHLYSPPSACPVVVLRPVDWAAVRRLIGLG